MNSEKDQVECTGLCLQFRDPGLEVVVCGFFDGIYIVVYPIRRIK